MLTVEFSQVAADARSLRVGLVVRYGQDGPIRFSQLVITDDALEWDDLNVLMVWLTRQYSRHMDREREVQDDLTLPGL